MLIPLAGVLVAVFGLPRDSSAAAAIQSIDVQQPRPFGYLLGDAIEHHIDLTLNHPYRLNLASLPAAGRLDRWLALDAPRLQVSDNDSTATRYQLTLRYRLINIEPGVSELRTPQLKLHYTDGQGQFSVTVNAWRFRVATLTQADRYDLRADVSPATLLRPAPSARWLGVVGAVLAAALAALAWLHLIAPWLVRRRSPFLGARAELDRLRAEPDGPQRYRRALAAVHRAFNQVAGRTVFLDDLAELFVAEPRLNTLRAPIEQYFKHSRQVLFATAPGNQADSHSAAVATGPIYTLDALAGLCRDCHEHRRLA